MLVVVFVEVGVWVKEVEAWQVAFVIAELSYKVLFPILVSVSLSKDDPTTVLLSYLLVHIKVRLLCFMVTYKDHRWLPFFENETSKLLMLVGID